MTLPKHKKVTWAELFFDLVYVYIFSQISHIIHSSADMQDPVKLMVVFTAFVSVISVWTNQTVFTNLYGRPTIKAMLAHIIIMPMLLVYIKSITYHFEQEYQKITVFLGFIFLIQLLQYVYVKIKLKILFKTSRFLKKFIVAHMILISILWFNAASPFLASYITILVVLTIGALTWTLLIFDKRFKLNTEHITERFGLIVIISFGEAIILLAQTENGFDLAKFDWYWLLIFINIASLFIFYVSQTDFSLNKETYERKQIFIIYLNFMVLLGVQFLYITRHFIPFYNSENLAYQIGNNNLYYNLLMSIALALFYLGSMLHSLVIATKIPYNRRWIVPTIISISYLLAVVLGFTLRDIYKSPIIWSSLTSISTLFLMLYGVFIGGYFKKAWQNWKALVEYYQHKHD
ncbi:low temperature requirement protein A [Mycoplasmopsis sturni]|uniref:low temperature requirement protein A n=1 Tax=Mycoplasmopsis sturni TaxID=39047 RepID=UPI00056CE684|nr:low temperature requirement protein A [Mycoplasmopsis sturni]